MARKRARLDPETARIIIVGAGLTGLATAISLQRAGFTQVAIFERDSGLHSRKEGYGLTLAYHPTGILQQLGVLEELAAADCQSRSHYLLASNGSIRGYFGNDFVDASSSTARRGGAGLGQRGNLRVPRQRVREILVQKLQSAEMIHWKHKLIDMERMSNDDDDDSVMLHFDNGTSAVGDVVIAADGIRSTVVQIFIPEAPLRSLNVRIILGISLADDSGQQPHEPSAHKHQLLRERGFYTLARGIRLFVMPYQGSALGRSLDPNEPVRFMWQLSFLVDEQGEDCSYLTSEQLQAEALERTERWHEPVQSLIRSTPVTDVWGTLLQDRDPIAIQQHLAERASTNSSVIVAGDALHAMSPFKGQGANRCLHDGTLIAKWLTRTASKPAAVKGAMREMVQRTAPTVQASREAAQFWHSPEALATKHKFSGLEKDEDVEKLLKELERRGIGAETKGCLDDHIRSVINDLGIQGNNDASKIDEENVSDSVEFPLNGIDVSFTVHALIAASNGELHILRKLSWEHPTWIRLVSDPSNGRTCLHVAAAAGHAATVHWLVTQAGCDSMTKDWSRKTALDLAQMNHEVYILLLRLQKT